MVELVTLADRQDRAGKRIKFLCGRISARGDQPVVMEIPERDYRPHQRACVENLETHRLTMEVQYQLAPHTREAAESNGAALPPFPSRYPESQAAETHEQCRQIWDRAFAALPEFDQQLALRGAVVLPRRLPAAAVRTSRSSWVDDRFKALNTRAEAAEVAARKRGMPVPARPVFGQDCGFNLARFAAAIEAHCNALDDIQSAPTGPTRAASSRPAMLHAPHRPVVETIARLAALENEAIAAGVALPQRPRPATIASLRLHELHLQMAIFAAKGGSAPGPVAAMLAEYRQIDSQAARAEFWQRPEVEAVLAPIFSEIFRTHNHSENPAHQ